MWNFHLYENAVNASVDCPNNIALVENTGQCMSYKELEQTGDEIAHVVGKRCLVFSLCKNTIGSIVGYTGFIRHHIVPLLLSASMDTELFHSLYKIYQPECIWYPEDKSSFMKEIGILGETALKKHGYCLMKSEFYTQKDNLYSKLGLLLTTSGSTGSPKLVRQSYHNLAVNTRQIVESLDIRRSDRTITTLPMNYTYGLSIINSHLAVNASLFLTNDTVMKKSFWKFFKEKRCTSFGGVPYTYEMLDRLGFCEMELPYLKHYTQAGGKLSAELHRKFAEYAERNGKKFTVMYGQCEAAARMAYLPSKYSLKKVGAMGVPVSGGAFRLEDEAGQVVTEVGKTGELIYKGENVALGYAVCRKDLGKGDEFEGVLYTGDMARFDEDGVFYIIGRTGRFVKLYGNRVSLDDIEGLVKEAYPKLMCACSGKNDRLYLFLTEEERADEVRNFIAEKTGLNREAFQVNIVDRIPMNESKKVLYDELGRMCNG